jgi:hypothetical protein
MKNPETNKKNEKTDNPETKTVKGMENQKNDESRLKPSETEEPKVGKEHKVIAELSEVTRRNTTLPNGNKKSNL